MTEPHGPEDGYDLDELAGYLEELEVGVDAHVTEPKLLGLRTQALGAVATPAWPAYPAAANPYAQTPDSWPGRPSPLPEPPIPVPPFPVPPIPAPLPSPLPIPPLPTEPVPAPRSSAPPWHEPEDGGRDADPRGISKRQR